MESKVTVNWFLQNWSQILVWVGTAGAVILFLLPWSRGGPAAWFFVFMAVMAVLNTILPIPSKLHMPIRKVHKIKIRKEFAEFGAK